MTSDNELAGRKKESLYGVGSYLISHECPRYSIQQSTQCFADKPYKCEATNAIHLKPDVRYMKSCRVNASNRY